MRAAVYVALLALGLAACGDGESTTEQANIAAQPADVDVLPADESAATPTEDLANGVAELNEADDAGSERPSPAGTPEASMIPSQYRGSWGMVPADCDQTRSDAKGRIGIGERTVSFYESRATLQERRPAIATSFSGLFAFTGEGQNWERVMTFTRTGDTLVRADETGRFTYRRCPDAPASPGS